VKFEIEGEMCWDDHFYREM